MAPPQGRQLVDATVGISCHAWSPKRDAVAYAPNSHELRIATWNENKEFRDKWTLNEHDMLISAMDWHSETNFLVTCSHDRNAFVWNYDSAEDTWKPSLVILRIERAALDVKWSPDGQKFAVGSSAKCVPVCYYEQENNWWVSKIIKKHKSSVLAIAWHPNSQLVATGASDFRARVFSSYIPNVDTSEHLSAEFPAPVPFGDVYGEYSASGWIHAVAYSPSGSTLAFAGHDSSVHLVSFGQEPIVQTLRLSFLPLLQLVFVSDEKLLGAGHDMNPAVFEKKNGSSWSFTDFLDKKPEKKAAVSTGSDVKSRMAMWQNKDKTGTTAGAKADDATSWLQHQGPITCLKSFSPSQFSTTSPDGKLVIWDI